MAHLSGGWMTVAEERCSLTKFLDNILEQKGLFLFIEKVFEFKKNEKRKQSVFCALLWIWNP